MEDEIRFRFSTTEKSLIRFAFDGRNNSIEEMYNFAYQLCVMCFRVNPSKLPDTNYTIIDRLVSVKDADEFVKLVEIWFNKKMNEFEKTEL